MNQDTTHTNGKEVKIAVLQEQMISVKRDVAVVQDTVTKILENHLPHLSKAVEGSKEDAEKAMSKLVTQINDLKIKMAYGAGGITVAWVAIQLLFKVSGK